MGFHKLIGQPQPGSISLNRDSQENRPANPASLELPAGEISSSSPAAGISGTARQLLSFCFRERVWLVSMAVFVLAWTIELYVIQAVTLVYPNETGARFAFFAPKIRLVLDLLFVLSLSFLLRRRWLAVAVSGGFFAYLGLITYFQYFRRPLSLLTLFANWREGSGVSLLGPGLFSQKVAFWLTLALVVQLVALWCSRRVALPRRCGWLAGGVLAVGYVALYSVANYCDPLDTIKITHGVGRLGEIRGYLGPWFAEWYYLRDDDILEFALKRREIVYDRLSPVEAEIPIHKHLVILQAESLDYNVLGCRANGQVVTPFMNSLRDLSMFYRVQAIHKNGSADADFAALNAVAGSDHTVTYKISGYPYQNTTPELLADCGYSVCAFHGNSGEFYDRRKAFEKMGFTELAFREELEGRYQLKSDRWGVPDREVLNLSAQLLRTSTGRACHFIITLTTHLDYSQLPDEHEIYSQPATMVERYLNNMRYLDNCLRDYITKLGSGTTVMIYADHPTEEGNREFEPDRAAGREFIPCFIFDTDQDLSKVQKTRVDPRAGDGSWNLIDVINYLRKQVARSCEQAHATEPVPSEAQ